MTKFLPLNLAMRVTFLIVLWILTVVLFALFGWATDEPFQGYTHDGPFYTDLRFEAAVGYAAIGVAVASYIVVSLTLLKALNRDLERDSAVALLIVAGAGALFVPDVIIRLIMRATAYRGGDYVSGIHLFQGEHGLFLGVAPIYTFFFILCAFVVFLMFVFGMARSNADNTKKPPAV